MKNVWKSCVFHIKMLVLSFIMQNFEFPCKNVLKVSALYLVTELSKFVESNTI